MSNSYLNTSILLLAAMTSLAEAQAGAPKLFRVQKDGKVGFINSKGTVVIPITYLKDSGWFSEGLAPVKTTVQGWEYIDEVGQTKFVLGTRCSPTQFRDGMAAVEYPGELFGYIDKQGREVIKPKFKVFGVFSEGFGTTEMTNGPVFIDRTGQVVFSQYSPKIFQNFSEGLAAVGPAKRGLGHLAGYIDRSGKLVIPLEYDYGLECKEGVLIVGKNGVGMGLSTNGEVAIRGNFQQLRPFSEGLAGAKINGKWGYVDHRGKVVIDPKYEQCVGFSEGLAGVRINGKWGFINKAGELVIGPNFNTVDSTSARFQGGLAPVREGTKTGYIDNKGNWVWPPSE